MSNNRSPENHPTETTRSGNPHSNVDPRRHNAPGAVTEDHLLGGRVRYTQPRDGLRAAIDPILLAAAVPARPGDRLLEGGTGAGAGFCYASLPGFRVFGG